MGNDFGMIPPLSEEPSSTYTEMVYYTPGTLLDKKYRIETTAVPIFGGYIYRACKEGQQENINDKYAILQMGAYVDCQKYKEENLEFVPRNGEAATQIPNGKEGGDFAVKITGFESLANFLANNPNEVEIKKVFLQIMTWLQNFHAKKCRFPFLNFHNILISAQNVIVLGVSFQYDYYKCSTHGANPYPHFISPAYETHHSHGAKYLEASDYYALAIMLWENHIKRTPRRNGSLLEFSEDVQAGIFTSFVELFTSNSYLNHNEPIPKLFTDLTVPIQKSSPVASYPDEGNKFPNIPMFSPNIPKTPPPQFASDPGLLAEIKRLRNEKQTWVDERRTFVNKQEESQRQHQKELNKVWLSCLGVVALIFACMVCLYLVGFRVITPSTIQNQKNIDAQQYAWYTFGLINMSQPDKALEICENWINTNEVTVLPLYFRTWIHLQMLNAGGRNNPNMDDICRKIGKDLSSMQAQKDRLMQEAESCRVPVDFGQIEKWLESYK